MSGESKWKAIDAEAGLWAAEYRIPSMPVNSAAVRLDSGYLIVSPGKPVLAAFQEEFDAPASFLLAPNSFHHMGLPVWREAFPAATVVAAPGAVGRLKKQGHSQIESLDGLREACPKHVQIVEPPSTRVGETWVIVKTAAGTAWVVCDAFFNMQGRSKKLLVRTMSAVLKSGPGLSISSLMKFGGVRDRRVYKAWLLDRLAQDAPTILVPGHGDVIQDTALPERLAALIERRL